MASIETPIVRLEEIAWLPEDAREFNRLVAERQHWKLTEDESKRCREDCDKRIEAMLLVAGNDKSTPKVQVQNWIVQRVTNKGANKLEPKRLLELGVSATVIQQATVEGKPYSYVLIKEMRNAPEKPHAD